MLAAHEHDRSLNLQRIDNRQIRGHVEIGARRHLLAVHELGIGQGLGDARVARPGMVARKDAADHRAVAEPPVMRAERLDLLGAFCQGRRVASGIGEGVQDDPADPLRPRHRKRRGAQRARRLAHEMQPLLPGLADHQLGRRDEIGDAARDIGITVRAGRAAVILVVHRPDVVAEPGKDIHRRVLAAFRHGQVERGQCRIRRAVHQEQYRPWRLASRWREPLAVDRERHLAFLDLVIRPRRRTVLRVIRHLASPESRIAASAVGSRLVHCILARCRFQSWTVSEARTPLCPRTSATGLPPPFPRRCRLS